MRAEDETHESWAVARFNRFRTMGDFRSGGANPGVSLFDSSIRHQGAIEFTITRASRHRDLHQDWIREEGLPIVQAWMSEAQFGALVSSFGQGGGVPVTLHRVGRDEIEACPFDSELARTAEEVAARAEDPLKEVLAEFEELLETKGSISKTALRSLYHQIRNVAPNMKYSANKLTQHAEDVVTKARADIEAMVATASRALAAGDEIPATPELLPPSDA